MTRKPETLTAAQTALLRRMVVKFDAEGRSTLILTERERSIAQRIERAGISLGWNADGASINRLKSGNIESARLAAATGKVWR